MRAQATRWHVLGAGALGSLFAARLIRAKQNVTMIMKDITWRQMGCLIRATVQVEESHSGGCWRAEATLEPDTATGPIHSLLVTTKCQDVRPALRGVVDRLTSDAVVVLLCNGMGVRDELLSDQRLAKLSFLLGTTTHGAFTTGRLQCVHAGVGQTWLGAPQGSRLSRLDASSVATSLDSTGLNVRMDDRIDQILWEKLAINASVNGLTALLECRNGAIVESANGQMLVESLCAEVGQLMEANKNSPPEDLLSKVMQVLNQSKSNFSSMHQDMMSGRATEIDYINGFVVKHGAMLRVPTPANRVVYDLIKMKEALRR